MRYALALVALLLLALQPAALSFAHIATLNGTEGGGVTALNNPAQIAFDSAGRIYIADSGNNRIVVYDKGLKYVTSKGGVAGNGPAELNSPTGVCVGADGKIYIADTFNQRVQVYSDYTGTYFKTIPSSAAEGYALHRPEALAMSSNGTLHVSDTFNDRIELFTTGGVYENSIYSSEQFGDYVFDRPGGVFVDERNGWILVADTGNNRVQIYDLNYTFIARLGWGEGNEGFSQPGAAVSDGLGRIYVADTGNNRVQVFAKNFSFITSLAGNASGPADSGFGSPRSVAVDSSGRLFVSDDDNDRVLVFQSVDVALEKEYTRNKIDSVRADYNATLPLFAAAQDKIGAIVRSGCTTAENASARLDFATARLALANSSLASAETFFSQEKYSDASTESDTASQFVGDAKEAAASSASMADAFVSLTGDAVAQMSSLNSTLDEVAALNETAHELNVTIQPVGSLDLALLSYENAKAMCASARYSDAADEARKAKGNATDALGAVRQQINIAVIPAYTSLRDEFTLAKSNITLYDLPLDATPLEMELSYANTLILDSNYTAALEKLARIRTNLTALESRISEYQVGVQQRRDALRSELAHQRARIEELSALAANYSQAFDSSRPDGLLRQAEDNLTLDRLADANASLSLAATLLDSDEAGLMEFRGSVDNATLAIQQAQADIRRAEAESLPLPLVGANLAEAKANLAQAQSELRTDPQDAKSKAIEASNAAVAEYNRERSRRPWALGGLAVVAAALVIILLGITGLGAGALAIVRYVRRRAKKIEKEAEERIIAAEEGLLGKKGKDGK